ncbi:hypothetical protein [Nocardia jiangxiensis]|uniref:hypothetical protein n=1 Tax=Nocardia jiangxiensis TaxID=282685 RepID=UPI0012F6E43C|nr:hypothetical protein [Nocardia jiangxiensis]
MRPYTAAAPALAAYEGRLFCAYVADGPSKDLLFTTWDEYHGWSCPMSCGGESSWGAPALSALVDELHLLFASNDQGREIIDMAYSEPEGPGSGTWARTVHQPNEFANAGVAAAGSATNGYSVSSAATPVTCWCPRWARMAGAVTRSPAPTHGRPRPSSSTTVSSI